MNLPLTPVTKDSCILALFANNRNSIHSLCDFRFVQNAVIPQVIELSTDKVLLYDSPIPSMECNARHQMIKGCNFCIFKLPCQCSLSNAHFYLPPRLISCNTNVAANVSKLHPVNLILLHKFFDTSKFQHIFGDSTFLQPLNVTVPNFKIYNHQMSQVLANDVKNHLNLSKMVEIAKNDRIVFQTLAEPLAHGLIQIPISWPDLNGILILAGLGFTLVTTILLFGMGFKIKTMSATLLTLQQAQNANALPSTLPSFVYTHKPTTEASTFDFNLELSWEHGIMILLFINTVVVLFILLKMLKLHKSPRLLMEVVSKDECTFIPIMKLPLCPSLAKLNLPPSVSEIKIVGNCFFPQLKINWTGFTVLNSSTEQSIAVPTTVSIPIWQKFKMAKMLKQNFYIQLHAEHYGYLSRMDIDESD